MGVVWTHDGAYGESYRLPLYRETNTVGIILRKGEAMKLLSSTMISSETSDKSTYASRLRYFDEGEESKSRVVLEALLSY